MVDYAKWLMYIVALYYFADGIDKLLSAALRSRGVINIAIGIGLFVVIRKWYKPSL